MKITSTLKVLAVGATLIAVSAPFEYWTPVAALLLLCTLVGGLTAFLIDNGDSVVGREIETRKAA